MKFSDETLMAYADGELEASQRAEIEAAMREDADIAASIARHRRLREDLQAAFDTRLDGAVPQRLIETVRTSPAASNIVEIGSARSSVARRWSWPEWSAIAASVLIGALIARIPWQEQDALVAEAGRMTASGKLALALDQQLSGVSVAESEARIGLTYRSQTGQYCRTFVLSGTTHLSGVACREGQAWNVLAVAGSKPTAGDDQYRMASTTVAPVILQLVQDSIEGDALDLAQETAARDSGWK